MPQKSYTLGNLLQDCLDCDIRKSDIRQFFDDLKEKAHCGDALVIDETNAELWIMCKDEANQPDEKTYSNEELKHN